MPRPLRALAGLVILGSLCACGPLPVDCRRDLPGCGGQQDDFIRQIYTPGRGSSVGL